VLADIGLTPVEVAGRIGASLAVRDVRSADGPLAGAVKEKAE
jgi:1-deoxy-D-xylulose-5-phosphate synthase